jgi:hypothetical protein
MIRDKRQCRVNAFRRKEIGHALPDKKCFAPLIVAAVLQTLPKLLGIEIHRHKGDISG